MIIVFSKNVKKLNEDKNGIDFSLNIENAQKSIAKVMNHRIEKLSSLLNSNESQLNVANKNEISNEHENAINVTSDNNSCSTIIKFEQISMPKSNRFKVNSSFQEHKCITCKKRFPSQSH